MFDVAIKPFALSRWNLQAECWECILWLEFTFNPDKSMQLVPLAFLCKCNQKKNPKNDKLQLYNHTIQIPQCQLRLLDLHLLLLGQPLPSQLLHLKWQPHWPTLPSGTPQLSTFKINSHSYKPLRICGLILAWSKRRWGTSSSCFTGLGLKINWLLCLGRWLMLIKVLLRSPIFRGSRDLRTYDSSWAYELS